MCKSEGTKKKRRKERERIGSGHINWPRERAMGIGTRPLSRYFWPSRGHLKFEAGRASSGGKMPGKLRGSGPASSVRIDEKIYEPELCRIVILKREQIDDKDTVAGWATNRSTGRDVLAPKNPITLAREQTSHDRGSMGFATWVRISSGATGDRICCAGRWVAT